MLTGNNMAITKTTNQETKIVEIKIVPGVGITLTLRERFFNDEGIILSETFRSKEIVGEDFDYCSTYVPSGAKTLYQEIADVSYTFI